MNPRPEGGEWDPRYSRAEIVTLRRAAACLRRLARRWVLFEGAPQALRSGDKAEV